MIRMLNKTLFTLLMCTQLTAYASNPTLVLQIPQRFYQHPSHMLGPFAGYWHNRGTIAEQVGVASFQAQQFPTSSCSTEAEGQALVVLEPHIFFNPKVGIFYSEITARVYTKNAADSALEKPLLTLKTEGQSIGTMTHNIEMFTRQAYQQAFDRLLVQLQENSAFQQLVPQAPSQTYHALCESIDTLAQPKLFY